MRSRHALSIVLAVVLGLSLTGCEQIKRAITPAPKIKHVTVAARVAAPGAQIVGTLPKGTPSNLPLWPGSNVRKERVTKGAHNSSWFVTMATPDPYQDVVDGTAKGFQDSGWQVTQQDVSSLETSVTVFTVSSSADLGVVTITARPDKTTQIGYVIAPTTK